MTDRTLDSILADIRQNEKIMQTEPELIKSNVRASYEMGRREAKDMLVKLRAGYQAKLLENSHAFFLQGKPEKVAQFVELTRKTVANAFVVSADAGYRYLAGRVQEVMGPSQEFSTQQVTALMLAMRYLARDMGIDDPTSPHLKDARICQSPGEVLAYVRELVRAVDQTIIRAYFSRQLTDAALLADCGASNVAVVVTDCPEADLATLGGLFGHQTTTLIDDADEIDDGFLIKVLGQRSGGSKKPVGRPKHQTTETK